MELDSEEANMTGAVEDNSEDLWYGICRKAVYVFDPRVQIEDEYVVILYDAHKRTLVKYKRADIRPHLRSATPEDDLTDATRLYKEWKQFYSSTLREVQESEPQLYQPPSHNDRAIAAHKARLALLGIQYVGVNEASLRRHRVTHCFKCGEHLDNAITAECAACNWILCECGACGCSYGL